MSAATRNPGLILRVLLGIGMASGLHCGGLVVFVSFAHLDTHYVLGPHPIGVTAPRAEQHKRSHRATPHLDGCLICRDSRKFNGLLDGRLWSEKSCWSLSCQLLRGNRLRRRQALHMDCIDAAARAKDVGDRRLQLRSRLVQARGHVLAASQSHGRFAVRFTFVDALQRLDKETG